MDKPIDNRLGEIDALFEEALELAPEDRRSFLAELAGRDSRAASAVSELLGFVDDTNSVALEPGLTPESLLNTVEPEDSPDHEALSMSLGPFRMIRTLGEGGMADVYLAERTDGRLEQRVAIKVLKAGLFHDQLVSRFEQERQILAALEHPNIARLLDGGVTPDGRPYLVMEYVQGLSIDRYCDRHRLTIAQRLELFGQLAEAVDAAHRSLVVHRDLKPSNILVDADGRVRLLDFGIAKLLDPQALPFASPRTETTLRLMTPEYASPEQVAGLPVTTATDVYQLGLVLYELLTGRRAQRLATRSPAEILHVIGTAEPVRPSRVADGRERRNDDASVAEVAARRRSTFRRLRRALQGDLDTIVLTALRKEPERRYGSVGQLVEDLKRYSDGLPIRARRATLGYRVSRFVSRHRWPVAAGVVAVVGLVAGLAIALWQARVAAGERDIAVREAEKARQVATFLADVFEAPDPSRTQGQIVTAADLLERGVDRIEGDLADQPEVRATLLAVMGRTYRSLGVYGEARPLLTRVRRIAVELWGEGDPRSVDALVDLGDLERDAGELDAAGEHYRQAIGGYREAPGRPQPGLARALTGAGVLLHYPDPDRAEQYHREAVDIAAAYSSEPTSLLADSLQGLGMLLFRHRRYEEAETAFREALGIRRSILGESHMETVDVLNSLGNVLNNSGRIDEAEHCYRRAFEIAADIAGRGHPQSLLFLNNLAVLLTQKGEHATAAGHFRELVEAAERNLGRDHPDLSPYQMNLARSEDRLGNVEAAGRHFERAVEIARSSLGDSSIQEAHARYMAARFYRQQGEYEKAEPYLEIAHSIYAEQPGSNQLWVANALIQLGEVRMALGRYQGVRPMLEKGLAIRVERYGDDHPYTAHAKSALAECLVKDGELTAAERMLSEALPRLEAAGYERAADDARRRLDDVERARRR